VEENAEFMKEVVYEPDATGVSISDGIVQPNLKLELAIQGIAGWRTLQCFRVSQLPEPYGSQCVFQIMNVKHVVQNGKWETAIECAVRLTKSLFPK
jgi:hypothetical protein